MRYLKIGTIALLIASLTLLAIPFQPATAASSKILEFTGTGTYTCTNGTTISGAIIFGSDIITTGKFGGVTGSWSVFNPTFTESASGAITGGKTTASFYSVTGTETFDSICNTDTITGATVTISGVIGNAVVIKIASSNGESGLFAGLAIFLN